MLPTRRRSATLTQERSEDHPVKLTALLYLREALHEECYEEMPEFVAIAKEFGADDGEIREALTPSGNEQGGRNGVWS